MQVLRPSADTPISIPNNIMDKEVNHTAAVSFLPVEYSLQEQHQQRREDSREGSENGIEMVDYMLMSNTPQAPPPPPPPASQISFDKLSFAEVMQFADFGPKLTPTSLGHSKVVVSDDDDDDEENYFLRFHILSDHHRLSEEEPLNMAPPQSPPPPPPPPPLGATISMVDQRSDLQEKNSTIHNSSIIDLGDAQGKGAAAAAAAMGAGASDQGIKVRRKRPRTMKTSEEVESQRMTHIAVERNRRRQMNEHLRVLRSLMPSSYVQRGDQASIIGGAIEFVRELEQLLQCLESQKRRRLLGGGAAAGEASARQASILMDAPHLQQQQQYSEPLPPFISGGDTDHEYQQHHQSAAIAGSGGLFREEMAESKSCLADVEVRLLGVDAMIKILCRRRPGQLVKAIAALEEHLQLSILHTNITTIEQTVLYSFNVKMTTSDQGRSSAEDIANSVQQILSLIDANTI